MDFTALRHHYASRQMRAHPGIVLLVTVLAALAGAAIGGCGDSPPLARTPKLAGLPLVTGSQVEIQMRTCDRGANAYCQLQLVVVGAHYRSSLEMLRAERRLLQSRHWSHANAPIGLEAAADAPSDRLRVTYATASNELRGFDLGWINRARPITLALAHDLLAQRSALAVVLQLGTG